MVVKFGALSLLLAIPAVVLGHWPGIPNNIDGIHLLRNCAFKSVLPQYVHFTFAPILAPINRISLFADVFLYPGRPDRLFFAVGPRAYEFDLSSNQVRSKLNAKLTFEIALNA